MSTHAETLLDDSWEGTLRRMEEMRNASDSKRPNEQDPSNSGDERDSKRSKSADDSDKSFQSADEVPNLTESQRNTYKKEHELLELLAILERRDRLMEQEEEAAEAAARKLRKPAFKRYNFAARPILHADEVPADWHHEDTDIDEYDIDAMIERCEQRIHDAVLPQLWEEKLEQYKQMKANREALQNEPDAAYGVPVLARLQTLTAALKHIEEWGDVFHQKVF
ncbi:hypothetical protein N7540_012681 [Penicillium herquei]|nr:hypothetical protein N7540_012681 [Penicillium herquei]